MEGVAGFDPEKSREYYDAYITHRLNGVAAGHFAADDYTAWMALALALGMLESAPLKAVVRGNRPDWLAEDEDLLSWLEALSEEVGQ